MITIFFNNNKQTLLSAFSYKLKSYMYLVKIQKFCCSLSFCPKIISVKISIGYLHNCTL